MVDIKIQLPDNFFEEEERWGFKITKERKELWAVELDLLCEFDRVCKKLGLKYFLISGTLLGAVRDGHFIPWDDDIDVTMLREDYDQLLKYGPAEFSAPMFLQNAYTDVDYRRGLSQLRRSDTTFVLEREIAKQLPFNQGICIDIFPLDGIAPDEELEQHFEEKQALRKEIGNLAKKIGHDPNEVREMFREFEKKCSKYVNAEDVDVIMHKRNTQSLIRWKREWFREPVTIKFEGLDFPIPIEYHKILVRHYGQNFIMPQQVSTEHGDIIWDVDVAYTERLKTMKP